MPPIAIRPSPDKALLASYRDARAYTDCFSVDVSGAISLPQYIEAFYTTPLFKLERLVLLLVSKPSTDASARLMAYGESTKFAAWTVEARTDNQILLCDYLSKTRSWLICAPLPDGSTRLYFGSAITPRRISATGRVSLGLAFRLLLGPHRLYTRALLWSAAHRLMK